MLVSIFSGQNILEIVQERETKARAVGFARFDLCWCDGVAADMVEVEDCCWQWMVVLVGGGGCVGAGDEGWCGWL